MLLLLLRSRREVHAISHCCGRDQHDVSVNLCVERSEYLAQPAASMRKLDFAPLSHTRSLLLTSSGAL